MTVTGTHTFDSALQTANEWLHELQHELHMDDAQDAYQALRAVLHTLRDRLPVHEAVHLSAQLPMLIRGLFFEGWHPADKPAKLDYDEFLQCVSDRFQGGRNINVDQVTRGVFSLLSNHITGGEVQNVRDSLPKRLQELWR